MQRRTFIQKTLGVSASALLAPLITQGIGKAKSIMLVSGWQDVNIGDITHTPGLLHILETYLPEVSIVLWKRSRGEEVKAMLNTNHPKVKIIYGDVDGELNISNPEVTEEFKKCDLMIHGSGPSIVGQANLEAWVRHTGKPFGVFGTTIQDIRPDLKALLLKASFIFTRETASLKVLKENGITGAHTAFVPDATFYLNLKESSKAEAFLNANNLQPKKFICVIPRLRYTPYHKFSPNIKWTEEKIKQVETVNEKFKETDHAKMREAMITWVKETGNKILVCPEMTYQVDIMDELLINPLPEEVKPFVIKRGFWLPDEAASVYANASAVLSFECHSPIIAAAKQTPFFYLRQPEDTIKGQMYYDLNFDEWIFEIDQTTGTQISDRLMGLWKNYSTSKKKLAESMAKVGELYDSATRIVAKKL